MGYAENAADLDATAVDSTIVGSNVLAAIEMREPQLLQACDQEEVGGHIGMILWNQLAERPEPWYFYPKATSGEEAGGTMYSHKKKPTEGGQIAILHPTLNSDFDTATRVVAKTSVMRGEGKGGR